MASYWQDRDEQQCDGSYLQVNPHAGDHVDCPECGVECEVVRNWLGLGADRIAAHDR